DAALTGYNYVINQPKNSFTEKSLFSAGNIYYRQKNYDKALTDFEQLETVAEVKDNIVAAQTGQMRSSYKLQQYDKAIANADKLANSDNASKDLQNEAHLVKGLSAMTKNDLTTSKSELTIVSKRTNSEM